MAERMVYIQLSRHNEIQAGTVRLKDIAKLYSADEKEKAKLQRIELMTIPQGDFGRYSISAGEIAEKIERQYPAAKISFLGDPELILEYPDPQKTMHSKAKGEKDIPQRLRDWLWTVFVSVVIFVGSCFTIMTFIRESNTEGLFLRIYNHLGTNTAMDLQGIEIGFAIGMGVGMLLYFNHFGSFRLQNEPTPMEMEMHQYMQEAEETLLETDNVKDEKG